ncbi:MAG: DNA polymerase I [Clostridia bacterium]|nr:DNA polymerase I [Clostridia bacterium]
MKVLLLDGYSLMYRAYHALATAPMTAPDGTPTTAIHGFAMMLLRLIADERPDRMAVAFDAKAATFRHQMFDGYKATRSPMPDDLRAQDPVIRELISLMGIPLIEKPGYEADDILGTISLMCEEAGDDALIITGDRDSFQLAGPHTRIMYTRKGLSDTVIVDEAYVQEKYGVNPKQLIEVKALMGDSSDNIPGISGIGEKTALRLIAQYGDLETTLASAETGEKGKLRERLMTQSEAARMSRKLAEIDRRVPLDITPDSLKIGDIGGALFRFRELGMNQVSKSLAKLAPQAAAPAEAEPAAEINTEVAELTDIAALADACAKLAGNAKWAAIDIDSAFTLATDAGNYLLALGGGDLLTPGVTEEDALNAATPLIKSGIPVYACGMVIGDNGEDAALMAYCVNPQRKAFTAHSLSADEDIASIWSACPALAVKNLADIYEKKLSEAEMTHVYRDIELPLSRVLRDMEKEGFLVDEQALRALGVSYRARIAELTDEIYALAGEKFNINSPKQLSELLFVKMGLPAPKKTSQGFTTNAEVLENLASDYPICERILEYRKYKKLESTYIDALINMRDDNGRVHTTFDQTATATGRISSLEPNLQNIPVRTELGRGIRETFVARPGWLLVDADYSQIELRVLAHISGDEAMINAFNSGEDIHRMTAAEVHGIAPFEVTGEMRSAAKAVNFGIVYGISDFTLARNIHVSRAEAKEYIEKYFARYPGVKRYLDSAVAFAKENGYARTLMGRRRYIPEIASSNFNIRSFGERCAMNSPIQGAAADIIKIAMVRVHEELKKAGLQARLILQVHDELMVEAPKAEADQAQEILRRCMENVAELKVPLKTDISVGRNWLECK